MSSFRTVLALDTAMSGCSVCVYNSDKDELVSKSKSMVRGQAEHLVPLVEEVMLDVGLDYQELDAVITTVGPGAFTGLRIGLSTARSLALALSIPIYGITTLQVLALEYVQRCDLKGQLVVLIETKRDDFYVQVFDKSG
ncbi:MAG: tRNA (adenosine(37)-N6)-threonylcarbamoyltransferase complex dimerization subunit type 1 TsaB, partial [Alphaproteobacteria bacterium]|nr:tRNA (adenosine(37)-N6)-threonylcarbamoyltransferase complex dimerization subunit type 1 TsaB [Alphaproteobacteria bacterium]